MTKVLLIGSSRHLDDDDTASFEATARKIGQQLAIAKVAVVACSVSESTFDRCILEGMNGVEGPHAVQYFLPEEEFSDGPPADLAAFRKSMSNLQITSVTVNGGWRPTHVRAIRAADVVLAVGGSQRGTGTVIYSAEVLEKPVVLIRAYRGAANDAWQDLSHYYNDSDRQTLEASPTDSWPADIVKLCVDFGKRNPMQSTRIRPAVIMGAMVIFLLVAFLMLIGDWSVAKVTLVAVVSAILGVVLRHAANFASLDLKVLMWDLIQAIVIGSVLVGFAATLIGIDFFKQIHGDDRVQTLIKFGITALLAGLVTPNFVDWLTVKAKGTFPGMT